MNSKDILARVRPHWPHPRRLVTVGLLSAVFGLAISTLVAFS